MGEKSAGDDGPCSGGNSQLGKPDYCPAGLPLVAWAAPSAMTAPQLDAAEEFVRRTKDSSCSMLLMLGNMNEVSLDSEQTEAAEATARGENVLIGGAAGTGKVIFMIC